MLYRSATGGPCLPGSRGASHAALTSSDPPPGATDIRLSVLRELLASIPPDAPAYSAKEFTTRCPVWRALSLISNYLDGILFGYSSSSLGWRCQRLLSVVLITCGRSLGGS